MELHETIRRRAMVRSFAGDPVDPAVVDRLLQAALRSPTAGNTGATAWLVLDGETQTAQYWEATTDKAWRRTSRRWDGLRRAPVLLLAYVSSDAYLARYAEKDKASSGLGVATEAWAVPYWFGDAAFGVMAVLLAAVDAGLGACFFGNFRGEMTLATMLGVPDEWRLFGAVALGYADGADYPSPSLRRPHPPDEERIRRGRW
jgi:nitroreductase